MISLSKKTAVLAGTVIFLLGTSCLFFYYVTAKESSDLAERCQMKNIEKSEKSLSVEDYRKLLEECEQYFEEKSREIEKQITATQQQKKSLSQQIYLLENKVKNLNYKIYQSNVMIKDLTSQIADTQSSITQTNLQIEKITQHLSSILQLRYEKDQESPVEIFLSGATLSEFFSDLMALENLNLETQDLLKDIKNLKENLEEQERKMEEEKRDLENVLRVQILQKQESTRMKQEQEYLLTLTEAEYQRHLQEKEKTEKEAAAIRARIFELIGVPKAPTFGEALEVAQYVEKITGVRSAFLLAVMAQESDIGKNVGQCYLPKSKAENIKRRIMAPGPPYSKRNDVACFLEITKALGRNPYNTPVSCPMKYGWGGAMGPAQFIPSTWMMYKDRVEKITGKEADPWNIKDAFLAAGLYLADYGAAKRTYNAEWKAAMIYFSGTSRRTRYNGYGFYGDSVMRLAKGFEKDIETITSSQ